MENKGKAGREGIRVEGVNDFETKGFVIIW